MKIRLSELRTLIGISLLTEADIARIAQRLVGSKNRALVTSGGGPGMEHDIVVIDPTLAPGETEPQIFAGVTVSPPEGRSRDFILSTLFTKSAPDAVLVLYATLKEFKRIVPDASVSSAAQDVIKRYYEEHKDDPSFIERSPRDTFLTAVYLSPPGPDVEDMKLRGEEFLSSQGGDEAGTLRLRRKIVKNAREAFFEKYNDPVATGKLRGKSADVFVKLKSDLEGAMRTSDAETIADALERVKDVTDTLRDPKLHEDEQPYYVFLRKAIHSVKNDFENLAADPQAALRLISIMRDDFDQDVDYLISKSPALSFTKELDSVLAKKGPSSEAQVTRLLNSMERLLKNPKTRGVVKDRMPDLEAVRAKMSEDWIRDWWDETMAAIGVVQSG